MRKFTQAALSAGAAPLALGLALLATPSFAQEAQADVAEETGSEAIVVTGSRISRTNLEQPNPVVGISADEFVRQAPVSAEAVLRDLPGSAAGIGAQNNNGNLGIATFNLRGLGTNRNLVLLNNRRVVPSSLAGEVDLNVIPLALIERADVFTGGAVTTYGADAIAGVVNFVTKRNFEGIDVSSSLGVTERGDGQNFRLDAVLGGNFADGKGNVVIGMGYTKTKPVLQGNRSIGQVSRGSTCATAVTNDACTAMTAGTAQGSATAVPASLFFPLPPATSGSAFANGAQFDPATGTIIPGFANFNFNPLNLYQAPLDRWNVFAQGHYEVTPGIEAYAEAFYTRSTVRVAVAPTGTFSNAFQVPLNNQFLTPAQRATLCEFTQQTALAGSALAASVANCATAISSGVEVPVQASRRFAETGPRRSTNTSNVFQVTAGLRGKLTETLNFDVFGQYGEANRQNVATGTALAERVQQALRVNPTNPAACASPAPAACVPLNLFGGEGTITPAMLAFVGVPTVTFTNTNFSSVQGIVNGDLGITLPTADAPIGIALGAEYRRYGGGQFGDLPSATPGAILGAGGAFLTVDGEFHSNEVFGELNVPLVQDKPFFNELTVDGGFRYADYSNTGVNWTFKAGALWAPIEDIKFRGAWTRAVRSPNLGELFTPQNTVLNNLAQDPCQLALARTDATRTALCAAQLTRAGLPTSLIGSMQAPIAGQINVTTSGNINLQPERATTLTAGVVLLPSFLPGFSFTADWYRITVRNAITSPTVSDIVNGCFAPGQTNPNDARCVLINRNPQTGGLSGDPATTQGVFTLTSNAGFRQAQGVDFTANYTHDFGSWKLNWNVNGNHAMRNRFQSQRGSLVRECVGFYSVSCDPALPEWSFNMRTSAVFEKFDASLLWRYISGNNYEPRTVPSVVVPVDQTVVGSFGSTDPARVVGAYRSIPSYHWFDLNLGVNVTDNIRMSLLVENMFDRKAPDVGNTIGSTGFNSGNTFPAIYDALGRRYTMSAGLRF